MLIISDLYAEKHLDGVRIGCKVKCKGLPDKLSHFVRSTEIKSFFPPNNLDWAVVGLIYVAMAIGQDIHVKGALSEEIFYTLSRDFQDFLIVFAPSLKKIKIHCDKFSRPKTVMGGRVGTGFSAGVDSLFAVASHSTVDTPPSFRVTDLFVFGVGGMGSRELFEGFHERVQGFATSNDLQATSTWSNLPFFYFDIFKGAPDAGYEKTNSFRNASAALVFDQTVDRYLIASSYKPSAIKVQKTYNSAYIEPVILPMLSNANLSLISANAGVSRVDKTVVLGDWDQAAKILDVCIEQSRDKFTGGRVNCSRCGKCFRTLVTLDILGKLDRFDQVFDIAYYKEHRAEAARVVALRATQGSAIDLEVVEVAKQRGSALFDEVPAQQA